MAHTPDTSPASGDGLLARLGPGALACAPDAFVVAGADGQLLALNPAAERLAGQPGAALLGQPIDRWLVPTDPGAGSIVGRGEAWFGRRQAAVALHASGARVPVELTLSRVTLDGQEACFAWLRDQREQREVSDALERARRAAVEASEAKSRFVASMSHEIRTPLSAVLGYADLLERLPERPERRAWARQVAHNARHLLALVDDILDLSKIEAGALVLEPAAVSLFELMADLDGLFRALAEEKRLDLTLQVDGEVPDALEVDPLRLRQVLINLVSNAIKYTDRGRVSVRASVTRPEGAGSPRLRVEVADTGVGIGPADQARLFQPFTQVGAGAVRRAGAGLGLSIARRLARLLGGELSLRSEAGRGSTFTLELPVQAASGATMVAPGDYPLEELRRAEGEASPVVQGRRVLVVDDHDANRELARFHLEALGAAVDVARGGEEAVRAATARPYDLILMDMQMRGLDGYGATRRLRATGCRSKVVALTAHAMVGDRTTCLAAGCDDYLAKPLESRALRVCVERLLGAPPSGTRRALRPAPAVPVAAAPPPASLDDDRSPRLAALVASYVADLPRQALEVERALEARDPQGVRRVAHRLSGTAASFGFARLGDLARACDARLRAGEPLDQVAQDARELVRALRAAGG